MSLVEIKRSSVASKTGILNHRCLHVHIMSLMGTIGNTHIIFMIVSVVCPSRNDTRLRVRLEQDILQRHVLVGYTVTTKLADFPRIFRQRWSFTACGVGDSEFITVLRRHEASVGSGA